MYRHSGKVDPNLETGNRSSESCMLVNGAKYFDLKYDFVPKSWFQVALTSYLQFYGVLVSFTVSGAFLELILTLDRFWFLPESDSQPRKVPLLRTVFAPLMLVVNSGHFMSMSQSRFAACLILESMIFRGFLPPCFAPFCLGFPSFTPLVLLLLATMGWGVNPRNIIDNLRNRIYYRKVIVALIWHRMARPNTTVDYRSWSLQIALGITRM